MKKIVFFAVLLLLSSLLLVSAVKNPDKPSKGEWDFKPQKKWSVSKAGEELIAVAANLLASDDGTLYFHDFMKGKSFILDKDGKPIGEFEKRGEGPGEVKRHMAMYLAGDKVVVADMDKLHFFAKDGKFIKSIPNDVFTRRPNFFMNEDEFIYAPVSIFNLPGNKGEITHFTISSGKSKAIKEFSVFTGGIEKTKGGAMMMYVVGLTPAMIIGYSNNKLYYGKNDAYEINVSDLNGKTLNTFSIEREQKKISKEAKVSHFKGRGREMPPERLAAIVKSLPDKQTYFHNILVNEGYIYVFTEGFGRYRKNQQIDIFSQEGKYIYRANLTFGENLSILGTELIIKKDQLYVTLIDEPGKVMVGKYKITLPKL